MTDIDMAVNLLFKAAALALVVAGFDAALANLFQMGFLVDLPGAAQTFTYVGALVGGIDNLVWAVTGEGLQEKC